MAKVSAATRERLLGQQQKMQRGGDIISNKGFKKMRLRLLPMAPGELPGVECMQFYSKPLGKGTTSPATFGLPCPVNDVLSKIYSGTDKDAKDFAKEYCRRSTEYWVAVIDRDDPGEPAAPKVKVLQAKQTVYEQIVDYMIDEDVGVDITHPKEGCDIIVSKSGEGLDTKWKVVKTEQGPISKDKAFQAAVVEIAETYKVAAKMYAPKLDALTEIYEGLTGESEFPDGYEEMVAALESGDLPLLAEDESAAEEWEDPEEEVDEVDEEELEEEADEEAEDSWIDCVVSFEDDDGNEVVGTVTDEAEDEAGDLILSVVEDDGDENDPWQPYAEDCTVVEDEEEEEIEEDPDEEEAEEEWEEEVEEEEPEEEEPEPATPAGRKSKRTAKKATAKKTTKKTAAKKTAAKKTAKKAATKGARKPKGAAAKIRNKLG